MAYDATLPANNSLISSSELRNQFNGLKTLVDDCPTTSAMHTYVENYVSSYTTEVETVMPLTGFTVSDPPTQGEVQTVVNKLNELIQALHTH